MAVGRIQSKSWRAELNVFIEEEPSAVLDLTCLLVTGRASDALADFLGSGEQMTDRVFGATELDPEHS